METENGRSHAWNVADAVLAALLAYAAYHVANDGGFMHFNYHLHLAVSFLEGRLHIAAPPSWLTEFAFVDGRAYVYFDPFPAVFLMPLASVWGLELNMARVCIAVGALNVFFVRLLLGQLGVSRATANWGALLFGAGTVHFWAAEYGNTWMLGHLLAVLALTLAWLESTREANPLVLGLLCAMAATSRGPASLATPIFFVLALRAHRRWSTVFEFGLPLAVTAVLLGAYNYGRFGDPFDNGYLSANQALLAPEYGSFSWRYIGKNIYQYFGRLPGWQGSWPWLTLDDHGLSLLATTPAALLLFRRGWSNRVPDAAFVGGLALVACLLVQGLYLFYFWDGWRQFGSRYTLDYTPALIVALALRNDPRPGLRRWIFPALVLASVAVNTWGIWFWRSQRL
jgi:hypothetical protein